MLISRQTLVSPLLTRPIFFPTIMYAWRRRDVDNGQSVKDSLGWPFSVLGIVSVMVSTLILGGALELKALILGPRGQCEATFSLDPPVTTHDPPLFPGFLFSLRQILGGSRSTSGNEGCGLESANEGDFRESSGDGSRELSLY